MLAAFPFYSVIPRARGPIDSPPLLPWVPEPVLCPSLRRLSLSLFLIISSFWCRFFESPWLTFYSEVCLFLISHSSKPLTPFWFSFWPSFLFVIFPKWAESIFVGLKVFPATSFFIAPYSGSLRYHSLASWVVTLGFLLFLLHLWCLRTYLSFGSCVSFGISFELS